MQKLSTNTALRKSHPAGWLFSLLLLIPLTACSAEPGPMVLRGATMGTNWQVTYQPAAEMPSAETVEALLLAALDDVNSSMSTYRSDAEISVFNAAALMQWVPVSASFLVVLQAALAVHAATEGIFDVTVAPLVNLWGFGPGHRDDRVPQSDAIAAALAEVGVHHVDADFAGLRLRKLNQVALDFSALAKGFGVDQLAQQLELLGVENYLVDIGGELRVRGQHPRGSPWRLAIESPLPGVRAPVRLLSVGQGAVATSGDYRNFFVVDGQRYSHIIDPRSGYPVRHELVSVTVVQPTAMLADAWATALLAAGRERAEQIAVEQELAAFLIWDEADGLSVWSSPLMQQYLID